MKNKLPKIMVVGVALCLNLTTSFAQSTQVGLNCVADNRNAVSTLIFRVDLAEYLYGPLQQQFSLATNSWIEVDITALTAESITIRENRPPGSVFLSPQIVTISRQTLRGRGANSNYTCSVHTWSEIDVIARNTLNDANSRRAF